MGSDDVDDLMAEMAAETQRINAAEAERTRAIEAAERIADAVIAGDEPETDAHD
jgi:hypothetical protein